ncbi:hypothetical protein Ciccas_000713 [Cichlidogyrus casuarinus]|uniref:Uncharacterized protein n=1 Tax=Cichlidogyrus casuarinus TaxID=1844966 RepID=A0ABD2QM43_9PLAT
MTFVHSAPLDIMPSANLLTLEHNSNGNNSEDASVVDRYMNLLSNQDSESYGGFSSSLEPAAYGSNPSLNNIPANAAGTNFSMSNYMAPPYSTNKLTTMQNQQSASNDFRSLQNSPYYSHHGSSMGPSTSSPGNSMFNSLMSEGCKSSMRPLTNYNAGSGPYRELFTQNASNGITYQDRVHYYSVAQKFGFIVGSELERIKENSRRSTSQTYGRISAYFRTRYGETEPKTKSTYLQLGVRVPSKDHVSEIVGKGGELSSTCVLYCLFFALSKFKVETRAVL